MGEIRRGLQEAAMGVSGQGEKYLPPKTQKTITTTQFGRYSINNPTNPHVLEVDGMDGIPLNDRTSTLASPPAGEKKTRNKLFIHFLLCLAVYGHIV